MKINFRNIKVKDLDGNELSYDVSKSLGNFIYKVTPDYPYRIGRGWFIVGMWDNNWD
jgi:hypothetical protein